MKNIRNILLIEDSKLHFKKIKDTLTQFIHFHAEIILKQTIEQALHYLNDNNDIDLIILDINFKDNRTLNVLKSFKSQFNSIPIIILTGIENEEFALEIINAGADDYLFKSELNPRMLERSIRYSIERLRNKNTILAKQEQLYKICSNIDEIVWSMSLPEYSINFVSSAIERVYGRPLEYFYNNPSSWKDIVHPDDSELNSKAIRELFESGEAIRTCRIVFPDGTIKWIEDRSKLVYDKNDNPIRIDGLVRDITKVKENEEKLKLHYHAFDQIKDNVVITDFSGTILYANKSSIESLGLSENEIIGNTIHIYGENTEKSVSQDEALQKTLLNGYWCGNLINIDKNGSAHVMNCRTNVVRNDKGDIIALCGVSTDITEEINVLNELKTAKENAEKANQLKNEFLANMSHEIRTPLNGILGFNELLLSDETLTSEQKECLELMRRSGGRLLKLLTDILSISSIEAGKTKINMVKFDIDKFFDEIISLFQINLSQKKLRIEISLNGIKEIYTDPLRLDQIISNLLGNAIKYSDSGTIKITVEQKINSYLFCVSDEGIGIKENIKDDIFESFTKGESGYTRIYQGAGLGLSIAKQLVNLLGGTIWFNSKVGVGTSFYFTIPILEAKKKEEKNRELVASNFVENAPLNKRILKILVVDDEPLILMYVAKTILNKTPYQLETFNSGHSFLDYIYKNHDYDVILMDIQMPEINGFECLKKIREINSNVPVVAFTAYAMKDDEEAFLKSGFNAYIEKPVHPDKLLSIISDITINC